MKNMYRFLALIFIVVLILSTICGCKYVEKFTDPRDYSDIFHLAGRVVSSEMYHMIDEETRHNDFTSLLFPDTITGLDIESYYCIYDYSERFEILLSVCYSPEDYISETQRLSAIKHNGKILYTTKHFSYPAYVTALGYNNECSEYALLDEERHCIHYVYLQALRVEDIQMPIEYLPYSYSEYGRVEGMNFTVYNTPEVYIPVPISP